MRLLLGEAGLALLSVGEDANDGAVLSDTLEFAGDGFRSIGMTLGVLGEGLLLTAVPVLYSISTCFSCQRGGKTDLVEPPLHLVRQMFSPNRRKRAQSARRFDVADDTDDDHGRRFDDGDGFDNLSLVHFRTRSFEFCARASATWQHGERQGKRTRLARCESDQL